MEKPIEIILFNNGNTAAFDKDGNQIPELQVSWLGLYFEFLKSKGIDPADNIKFHLSSGVAKPFPEPEKIKTQQKEGE